MRADKYPIVDFPLDRYDRENDYCPRWWVVGHHFLVVSTRPYSVRIKEAGESVYLYVGLQGVTVKARFSWHRQKRRKRLRNLDESECDAFLFIPISTGLYQAQGMIKKALKEAAARQEARTGCAYNDNAGVAERSNAEPEGAKGVTG